VALLPRLDERFAVMWANEAAASASLTGIPGAQGGGTPLALRAKTAVLGPSTPPAAPAARIPSVREEAAA
ncbi:MAG: hypothetical protein MH204_04740, partial [Fimbriimonadaceae bacterium]|nr:hypothetical protein [Fimbriimonadaceae bacterium]